MLDALFLLFKQGVRSTTVRGNSVASSLDSYPTRGNLSDCEKHSSTADTIFEKQFEDMAKSDVPLKCKFYHELRMYISIGINTGIRYRYMCIWVRTSTF